VQAGRVRALWRWILAAAVTAAIIGTPRLAAAAKAPTDSDLAPARAALAAADAGKWAEAESRARQAKDPLVVKLIQWLGLVRGGNNASFTGIVRYIEENSDWPSRRQLLRRAEEVMGNAVADQEALAWFAKNPPVSAAGQIRLAEALIATGDTQHGMKILRHAWISANLSDAQERDLYKRYRKVLAKEDHVARLDRLLWEGRDAQVRRQLWRVDPGHRAWGEARLMLRQRRGNVDRALARVPADLRDDAGLVYERLRWRRVKGKYAQARELFVDLPGDLRRPDLWWHERSILARRALREGLVSDAYRIVKEHRLNGGPEFAEAEWLAGWIALRFLHDADIALHHFQTMFTEVNYPVSRARSAYWAGRTAEARQDRDLARLWHGIAASYPTTYYGQLAAARLGPAAAVVLPAKPNVSNAEKTAFDRHELTRAVRLVAALDLKDELRPFLLRLAELKDTPGWRYLTATLANDIKRPDLAIAVAKKSGREGWELPHVGFPAITPPPPPGGANGKVALEIPLVLAVVRQESAFQLDAVSRAGARGLMQLLPRTAREVARGVNLPYAPQKLVSDAAYNLKLGQAYLRDLLAEFEGSYVLALAAYNAGPKRAREWLKEIGDPRASADDAIDWVEMIPYEETRNYVQRVLENLQVYRLRLSETELAQSLEKDLLR
jgi:soluble lytic murein transglycosylase